MIKSTDRKLVVGLEIGTAKVSALVGEVLPDGMVNIIGVGSCPSRGMDKGGVNDLESVVKCVQRAIDQAELMADCQISSVYLALSGKHISCQNEIGMVPISEEEVTQDDVENVVHTAKSVRVRDEHRILHVIPQEYAIDYQEGIKNPVGLSGVRMQAKVHLITCHNDMAKNIVKAVERCGLKVDQLIFAGLAASYAVLTEDERELGVCVVDIGGGTTDCSVLLMGPQWRDRADRQQSLLGHSGCRVGGNDLDIMLAFKQLMPLFGLGGETAKGIALPALPYWNAVATNDVPAQNDFYSAANGRVLRDLILDAAEPEKVKRLLKVYQQRLSYRLVRAAEESKIALSGQTAISAPLNFVQADLAESISQDQLADAISQPLMRIQEQVSAALASSQTAPQVIYLTGGSARSPLLRAALQQQLPGIPIVGGNDFGSVTAGLARWAQTLFR
ncbi:cell division protein FtsA [Serratia marcescens]|nr:cell division protein FtsA [Serratia marcescens]RTF93200.1 cell division protein FtsA [Serratia marcescens]